MVPGVRHLCIVGFHKPNESCSLKEMPYTLWGALKNGALANELNTKEADR